MSQNEQPQQGTFPQSSAQVVKAKNCLIPASQIYESYLQNKSLVKRTPLLKSLYLSQKYKANIFLKREDLQDIRSFKIRGAGTAFSSLTEEEKKRGVVTASAGNHAQGVAYCCKKFQIKGTIFMPEITPKLKINSVRNHGGEWLDIRLVGDTYDDAVAAAHEYQQATNATFIHSFDNLKVIEGQGGVACEIIESWNSSELSLDYTFICCGGGGLLAGMSCYLKEMSPLTNVVGFQPLGSPAMYNSLKEDKVIVLKELETFVDGASMKKIGQYTFEIVRELKIPLYLVDEGLVSTAMLDLYQHQTLISEPAGAVSVAGLQLMKKQIEGKNVVCVISGSNNDISRLPEIRLRSKIYEKKEAYYIINSPSNPINLLRLVQQLVNPSQQQIILLNSTKKYNVSACQCVIGLQFEKPQFKQEFEERVLKNAYKFTSLSARDLKKAFF